MQNHPISVALLISTYNWPQALDLVLNAVAKQSRLPDEVVIADDGSGEETRQLITLLKQQLNLPIKHIWHEDKGFRKSLILNKAMKNITSDYIVEIDGDILIHKEFIADHLKAAQAGSFVQGSRAMISKEKTEEIMKSKITAFSIFSPGLSNKLNALRVPVLSWLVNLLPSNPFHAKSCNIAFWKSDYIKINGYDNRFEGWGGEDYEFAARLLFLGIKRKRMKMAGLAYHIFHDDHSRANTGPNDVIYRKTMAEKLVYTAHGYQQTENY